MKRSILIGYIMVVVIILCSFTLKKLNTNVKDLDNNTYTIESEPINSDNKPEECGKTELLFDEWGFKYKSVGGSVSSITTEYIDVITYDDSQTNDIAHSDELNNEPVDVDYDLLRWLDNDWLRNNAECVSYNSVDDSTYMAEYYINELKVTISLYIVSSSGEKSFEFGVQYPFEIYDFYKVESGYTWNCFSHDGYDGISQLSAVTADDNKVCEIVFDRNFDSDFIYKTLTEYTSDKCSFEG